VLGILEEPVDVLVGGRVVAATAGNTGTRLIT